MSSERGRKVVHFSTVHPASDVRVFRKECLTLRDAGYDVTLFARGEGGLIEGIRVKPVAEHPNRALRVLLGPPQLLGVLLRERAAVYHFHDPELLPVGFALRILGKCVIYDAHEWVPGDVSSKPYLRPSIARSLGWIASKLERLAARTLSQVVAATPFIASQLPGTRTTVIQNYPILAELSHPETEPTVTPRRRPNTLVYVGGLSVERCGAEILEAMRLVAIRDPAIRLVAAGGLEDGLDPTELENVDHLGYLDRRGVRDIMGSGLLGVVLLRDLPNCRDALPTKFFEYLAAGLAVVVSRSTAPIAEITEQLNCGRVVDETDPTAIADAIVSLLHDPREAAKMGERGRAAVVDRYDWQSEGRRLVDLYDRLTCVR